MMPRTTTSEYWYYTFEEADTTPRQVYDMLTAAIQTFEYPAVSFVRNTFIDNSTPPESREYLTISHRNFHCEVFAAHFGKNFCIAYRTIENKSSRLARLPFIGRFLSTPAPNGPYELFSNLALFDCIRFAIDDIVEIVSEQTQLYTPVNHPLTIHDRRPKRPTSPSVRSSSIPLW